MDEAALELLLKGKVRPLLADAMHRHLGVTVAEIESDIASHLRHPALLNIPLETTLPLKAAKRLFRKRYLANLLAMHSGHVTSVARAVGMSREALHRLLTRLGISPDEFRSAAPGIEYLRAQAVQDIIVHAIDQYHSSLNPSRVERMYKEAPSLGRDIAKMLPDAPPRLKEAEREFEEEYIRRALETHRGNISATARTIGIRFETLHRKCKLLGLTRRRTA